MIDTSVLVGRPYELFNTVSLTNVGNKVTVKPASEDTGFAFLFMKQSFLIKIKILLWHD